jgi:hypothetical protein
MDGELAAANVIRVDCIVPGSVQRVASPGCNGNPIQPAWVMVKF